ncbi:MULTISPECIES: thiamine pyrophosphate-dependent enzyme [unclassified Aureimonas]|uniref:alpha-ketoacid dehydrogenase subunit alpha/beta n=1 Tax=unclassified Aureimonas TaxID=2615206 RepID=UPI0006F4CF02|nr:MULTISPECIES: alpha-ketoacid dehydrogenase subunit alpha/beta [unclassified Aureimonas]KQT61225.1 dehydrogenase [Aureimonas sp. Leaf460]KQT68674.1 dehydrogenase [Aureimonas sp. Leaf427]
MPKEILVDPSLFRKAGSLAFPTIPVHAYAGDIASERAVRGDARLKDVLRHMMIVREFETMLGTFKATGAYSGIEYAYKGPAHLSIGHEGAAVGAALALTPDDHIFGSHRSHGEFIAKGLAAIADLDPAALRAIMEHHAGGSLLATVETHLGGADAKAVAENFLLFGLLAEIFMRGNGFNGGMGGSMHAFFLPFGAYPNNAIVGASSGIATGAALRRKLSGSKGITVANSGDGSTGCGLVWESMNFAAMAQFETLWTDAQKGGLPVLFFFNNNFYAMGGQTIGETMGWDRLSRIGASVNPAALHAETVDGTNPLAVADAVARKRALLLEGRGPALLDVECYRISGHSTTDANVYRSREEMAAWEAHDPITSFSTTLVEAGVMSLEDVQAMKETVAGTIRAVTAAAVDPKAGTIIDIHSNPTLIGRLMFSNEEIELPAEPAPDVKAPDTTARVRQNAKKSRFGLSPEGDKLSPMRAITLRDGLFEAILHHMVHDERLIAYGEECREWGGAFGVYRGLSDLLPHQRLFNSPISEAAIVSTAVGYAMEGGRALIELMYGDFIGRAGDEIFNQMAKWQSMSAGHLKLPVVLRCSIGSKYGAQHSQDWTALVAHIPGLKVIYPATPYDAKGLMASALASQDPVVVFESQRLYDIGEQFHEGGVPEDYYRIPFGQPDVKREGEDVTILTIGPSLYAALAAADQLQETHGLSAEVIDARTLVPFDYAAVLASVKKTGRLLLVSEASERGSFLMTLSSNITRFAFGDLKAPPRVLGSPNWIVPGAEMESTYFPQVGDIIDIVTGEFYPEKKSNRRGVRTWDDLELARHSL